MTQSTWTDDLSITVDPEHTLDELVDFILEHEGRHDPFAVLFEVLTTRFGLSFEDAELAVDRVGGGRVRAASGRPENAPEPSKDPVAYISYRRALGTPAPARRRTVSEAWDELVQRVKSQGVGEAVSFARSDDFTACAEPQEREAADLWCNAVEAGLDGTRAATSSMAAIRLLELAAALAGAPHDGRALNRVLLQVGTAISSVAEARIAQCGPERCAMQGTPAWFDAIRLGEAARELSRLFSESGNTANEGAALDLRGRIITSLLGHCRHRVGAVMLDSIRYCRRVGDDDRAASLCEAVIGDFRDLVEDAQDLNEGDALAARQLASAIEIYTAIRGNVSTDIHDLEARCAGLLEARAGSQG